jgi:hypothetical protein
MGEPIQDKDVKNDRKQVLVEYFTNENRHNNDYYAYRFFFCEFLNLVNVVGQIYLMDFFLGGEFTTYGSDVANLLSMTEQEQEQRIDPMAKVFPKVTKCTFHKFGPSGTVQKFDGLCILPLNIINEKIYVFLWFWFVIVAVVSAIQIIMRIVVITVPSLREVLLGRRLIFLRRRKENNRNKIGVICQKCKISDWFILYQLAKNIDPLIFNEFIGDLHQKFITPKEREAQTY